MEYLFVYDGKSWWLKLTSAEQIINYHQQTSRYEGAVKMYMKMKEDGKESPDLMAGLSLKEQINLMEDRDYRYLQCAVIKAQQTGGTLFDGSRLLNIEAGAAELENIRRYGAVFINPAGGNTHGIRTVQFLRRKQLVLPDFRSDEIRIKQLKDGEHRYAYIGDMKVRDGNRMKWDTEEEVRAVAEALMME